MGGAGWSPANLLCIYKFIIGYRCVYRADKGCIPGQPASLGRWGGALMLFGSWFQILSHLHVLPQSWISNCFEIAASANHLIALVPIPLELEWTHR